MESNTLSDQWDRELIASPCKDASQNAYTIATEASTRTGGTDRSSMRMTINSSSNSSRSNNGKKSLPLNTSNTLNMMMMQIQQQAQQLHLTKPNEIVLLEDSFQQSEWSRLTSDHSTSFQNENDSLAEIQDGGIDPIIQNMESPYVSQTSQLRNLPPIDDSFFYPCDYDNEDDMWWEDESLESDGEEVIKVRPKRIVKDDDFIPLPSATGRRGRSMSIEEHQKRGKSLDTHYRPKQSSKNMFNEKHSRCNITNTTSEMDTTEASLDSKKYIGSIQLIDRSSKDHVAIERRRSFQQNKANDVPINDRKLPNYARSKRANRELRHSISTPPEYQSVDHRLRHQHTIEYNRIKNEKHGSTTQRHTRIAPKRRNSSPYSIHHGGEGNVVEETIRRQQVNRTHHKADRHQSKVDTGAELDRRKTVRTRSYSHEDLTSVCLRTPIDSMPGRRQGPTSQNNVHPLTARLAVHRTIVRQTSSMNERSPPFLLDRSALKDHAQRGVLRKASHQNILDDCRRRNEADHSPIASPIRRSKSAIANTSDYKQNLYCRPNVEKTHSFPESPTRKSKTVMLSNSMIHSKIDGRRVNAHGVCPTSIQSPVSGGCRRPRSNENVAIMHNAMRSQIKHEVLQKSSVGYKESEVVSKAAVGRFTNNNKQQYDPKPGGVVNIAVSNYFTPRNPTPIREEQLSDGCTPDDSAFWNIEPDAFVAKTDVVQDNIIKKTSKPSRNNSIRAGRTERFI